MNLSASITSCDHLQSTEWCSCLQSTHVDSNGCTCIGGNYSDWCCLSHNYVTWCNIIPEPIGFAHIFTMIVWYMTLVLGLPLICIAIYALVRLRKANNVLPVFVINLLISDIIQILSNFNIPSLQPYVYRHSIDCFAISACVFLMLCISHERYLLVTQPLWYRCHYTVRRAILISISMWFIAAGNAALLSYQFELSVLVLPIVFVLAPCSMLYFFVRIWLALSSSISLSDREKNNIRGTLLLALAVYIVFFQPYVCVSIYSMAKGFDYNIFKLVEISMTWAQLNALVNPLMYIFMRKDVPFRSFFGCKKLLHLKCCRRFTTDNQVVSHDIITVSIISLSQ